jgi:hypothetical protein
MFVKFSEIKVGEFFALPYQNDNDIYLKSGTNSVRLVASHTKREDIKQNIIIYSDILLDCSDSYDANILIEDYASLLLVKVPDYVVFVNEEGKVIEI